MGPEAPKSERPRPIWEALDNLKDNSESLLRTSALLTERLTPVMLPSDTRETEDAPRKVESVVAEKITNTSEDIILVTRRLEYILDNLEI